MKQKKTATNYQELIIALSHPKVGPLLLVRFLIMLAYTIFWSVFALFAQIKFHLNMQSTGFVMAYIGFFSVLVQGVGIGLLTKRFKDRTIITSSLWLMFLGLIGWSIAPNLPFLLLVILPLSGGGWILNTVITSAITKAVHLEEIGGVLGISSASDSLTRLIAPVFSSYMLGGPGTWAPGAASAALLLLTIWFAHWRILRVKESIEARSAESRYA